MDKQEFLFELRYKLSKLPSYEIDDQIDFISESIDDRIEEGLTEEEAIAQVGTTDELASQIIKNYPLGKLVNQKIKGRKKLSPLAIVLIILGSPIWLSLLLAVISVVLAIYISIWAIVLAFWSCVVAVAVSSIAGFVFGLYNTIKGEILLGPAFIGASLVLAGVSILLSFCGILLTKLVIMLTGKVSIFIKRNLMGKEEQ